jgi:hypothetical protein
VSKSLRARAHADAADQARSDEVLSGDERIPFALRMKTRSRPTLLATLTLALALIVCAVWVAPLLAAPTKGQVGEPPTRQLEPPLGPKDTPALVIGRARQPKGHMEIVSYGARASAGSPSPQELCTWIEFVPGESIFASCGELAELRQEERAVKVELFGGVIAPKDERSTELGGLVAPNVASIRLRPLGRGRAKPFDARITVTQVRGGLRKKLRQPAPFGYFFAQIKGRVPGSAIEVRAYDAGGNLLGSAAPGEA